MENTITMKPVLIYFNENAYNAHISQFEPQLTALNGVLKDYDALGLKPLTESEFKSLFASVPNTVFDKMTEKQPLVLGGFTVDRSKAMDIITKPAGYEQLSTSVKNYKNMLHQFHVLKNIELRNNEIVLTDSFLENEKNQFEIWGRTEDSIKAFDFATGVVELAINIFGEGAVNINRLVYNFIKSKSFNPGLGLANHSHYQNENTINHKMISMYNQPGMQLLNEDSFDKPVL